MLAEILGGLADAVAGVGLRQGEREVGRAVERARRLRLVLEAEGRLGVGDAVVVLELVRERERAARLQFRLLVERDGRRLVRNGVEGPDDVVVAEAGERGGAAVRD